MVTRHPERFTWDYWYVPDPESDCFAVYYLNAESSLYAFEQHHGYAAVGYAQTKDFLDMEFVNDAALTARPNAWDNTSIWSGDAIRVAEKRTMMFYTSRTAEVDDGYTQYVGIASSEDSEQWERVQAELIAADGTHFEPRRVEGEESPQAWRDPFLFMDGGHPYMVLAAKSAAQPLTRKGAVALLRATKKDSLLSWEIVGAGYAPGTCEEIEVPQLYINEHEEYVLTYSCHAKFDFAPSTAGAGGFQAVTLGKVEEGIEALFAKSEHVAPEVLVPEFPSYACRVIPELGGKVIGFDIESVGENGRRLGGFIHTGVSLPNYRPANRDFSWFTCPAAASNS